MPDVAEKKGRIPFEVDDAIVLLLGAESRVPSLSGRLEGITRLEKLVFLLEKESKLRDLLDEELEFHAYDFGPFSSKIYQAVDVLEAAGLIQDNIRYSGGADDTWETVHIVGEDAPYSTREFVLTDLGRKYFAALLQEIPEDLTKEVSNIKDRFGSMPLRQLVRYVYKRYPAYTEKSKIRDQVLD
jgi:hypothetical protein